MEAKVDVEIAVSALDVEVDVAQVVDITEHEFLSEFARVMHEWNFVPFQRGEVCLPTLAEAREALGRSRYTCG